MKLKIVYFGSPDFSAYFLEKILTDEELKKIISVEFVVTQPDKPAGRKQIITPTPVKKTAIKYQIPIKSQINLKFQTLNFKQLQNSKQKNFENLNLESSDSFGAWNLELGALKDIDIGLVYAYSQIIPKEILELPRLGFWCLHPSLLPKYRGPSPIAYALLNSDKKTGTTIFKMDEKIDHGPIIAQKSLTILPTDYRPNLEKKLTDLGFEIFKKIIIQLSSLRVNELKDNELKGEDAFSSKLFPFFCLRENGIEPYKKQNDKLATYTRILKKEDGYIKYETLKKLINNEKINFEELPEIIKENYKNKKIFNFSFLIFNFFKALYPWPGVWTILPNGKRLKIIEMRLTTNHQPLITKVQLEGKKEIDFQTFKKAYGFF